MNNAPCKNCTKRKAGCHALCKAYKDWKEQTMETYKKGTTDRLLDSYEKSRAATFRSWVESHK